MSINEGAIATHMFVLGPRDVKVLVVDKAMNTAVIQFRDLDQPPTEQNTSTVLLSSLRAK